MDLVDIDKVLDDLELIENHEPAQHHNRNITTTSIPTNSNTTITPIIATNIIPSAINNSSSTTTIKQNTKNYNNLNQDEQLPQQQQQSQSILPLTSINSTTITTSSVNSSNNSNKIIEPILSSVSSEIQVNLKLSSSPITTAGVASTSTTTNPSILSSGTKTIIAGQNVAAPASGSFSYSNNNSNIEERNKKLVTVSNVFSSLDDYRRDVECLQDDINRLKKYDNIADNNIVDRQTEKITTINDNSSNIKDVPDDDGDDVVRSNKQLKSTINNRKNEKQQQQKSDEQQQQQTDKIHISKNIIISPTIENDDNDDNDDEDPTEDYHEEPADADYITSASSITTSSPSSFSSGPSPGSSSSTSESCSLISGLDCATASTFAAAAAAAAKLEQKLNQNKEGEDNNDEDDNDDDDDEDDNNDRKDIKNRHRQRHHHHHHHHHHRNHHHYHHHREYNKSTTTIDEEDNLKYCEDTMSKNEPSVEIGLSSISSCLYNENTSSSIPGLSQDLIKTDAFSSISNYHDEIVKQGDHQHQHHHNYSQQLQQQEQDQEQQVQHQQQIQYPTGISGKLNDNEEIPGQQDLTPKIVGFGSTMDEISDTELDSLLQEIDCDSQIYSIGGTGGAGESVVQSNNNEIDQQITTDIGTTIGASAAAATAAMTTIAGNVGASGGTALATSEDLPTDQLISVSNKEGGGGDGMAYGNESVNDFIQSKKIEDEDNLQNADSFSQASTIEFAELRLQSDFETDALIDEKSTSNNSGTKADRTVSGDLLPSPSSICCSDDGQENDELRKNKIDGIQQTISDFEIDSGSSIGVGIGAVAAFQTGTTIKTTTTGREKEILQRPNSLDLPPQNSIEININSTAGQTPPASRLDDASMLSSSSSEDIPSRTSGVADENQGAEGGEGMQEVWCLQEEGQQQQQQQDLPQEQNDQNFTSNRATTTTTTSTSNNNHKLGKVPPFWIPDSEANACMQCKQKFSLIKRRHHCRACGKVLCSACCSQKAKLEFLGDNEVRVCVQCHLILNELNAGNDKTITSSSSSDLQQQQQQQQHDGSGDSSAAAATTNLQGRSPNPNNPMEYCSVIPPHQQVSQQQQSQSPISVMVPVGVLKREGSSKNGRKDKNVIFSDGIRPGCDLTELDNNWDNAGSKVSGGGGGSSGGGISTTGSSSNYRRSLKRDQTPPAPNSQRLHHRTSKQLPLCNETDSYIPKEVNALPPIYVTNRGEHNYKEVQNDTKLIEQLQHETLRFAIQRNFYVFVKIVKLKCCINKIVINFTTFGMHHVGQDEIIILLELDNSGLIPKDIFIHLNDIYQDSDKGFPITELGFSLPKMQNFLGYKECGGFLYIRPTFQCLQEVRLPESPFLIGILIHRWEVPWAKNFPLRLMLRLGAQYRYYPSPHISVRGRDAVYGEISQTIINFLADFRNYTYTIGTIKGMYIHMEDRRTSISIPKNRYDQVIKAMNNSSDHILALGGNFSKKADGHLVCIQNMETDCPERHTYSTQAINIQGQPRKVTGASFIVLNGALKTTSGLSGKCSIVEDGLMVQVLPTKMTAIRNALKNMKDVEIICGPVDADESQTEVVNIKWTENDLEFNIGVKSPIDSKRMDGIPSIRVHSGLNFSNANHIIRWSEVFIIQSNEEYSHGKDPVDISKLAEQIAKSTSKALVSFLDLLATNDCIKIGLRATLHQENVCYEAGSKNLKLAPLYMNALDNELIPTLHKQTTSLEIDTPIILELIFHVLDK